LRGEKIAEDEGVVDLKKISSNIASVRENIRMVRENIRSALGIQRPRIMDLLTGAIAKSSSTSTNVDNAQRVDVVNVRPVPIENSTSTIQVPRLGIVDAVRKILEESAKQVELKTKLLEAQVEYYKKQLEEKQKVEEARKRGMHW